MNNTTTAPTVDEIAQWGMGPLADLGPTDTTEYNAEPAPICFSNRIHKPHGTCAGLDADTLFERTMDAQS